MITGNLFCTFIAALFVVGDNLLLNIYKKTGNFIPEQHHVITDKRPISIYDAKIFMDSSPVKTFIIITKLEFLTAGLKFRGKAYKTKTFTGPELFETRPKRLLAQNCLKQAQNSLTSIRCLKKKCNQVWIQACCSIDDVNFVYNKCDLEQSLGILAGKILHWSYWKVDILSHNFHINPRVMKEKSGQVLRCAPFHHIKS